MKFKRCFSLLTCICLLTLSFTFPSRAASLPYFYVEAIASDGTWVQLPYNASTGLYATNKLSGYSDKKWVAMTINITKQGIPKSGTYGVWFNSNEGNIASWNNVSSVRVYVYDSADNVAISDGSSAKGNYAHTSSGGVGMSGNVKIGYNTSIVRFYVTFNQQFSDLDINPAGYFFKFTEAGGSAGTAVSPEIENSGTSGADNAIANNTGTLVEQQEETNGLLVQIISTISNQLTAFWNQLAGEFTNLFNKMSQQHQEAMEAVEDQTSRIEDSVQDQTQKIQDKLEDVKTGIISGIINGLKSLFIPSDEFFKTYFDDLFSWFSDRLGFLSFPIDLLAQLVEMFLGSSSTDFVVTLPSFEIMGEPLLHEASFNLTQFLNENFGFLLTAIHLGVSVIMVFGFIKLCERKWEEVMMN